MVNYCCVYGCGSNSKSNANLSFYSLPNGRHRQLSWLKAAGREDLLEGKYTLPLQNTKSTSIRFCSRHFSPQHVKNRNRHLLADVVPTLCLPGQWGGKENQSDDEHDDIVCNSCNNPIVGFRYKCVTCEDYDLCLKCEIMEAHRQHFMLRIPKPMKFKQADKLLKKWRKLFNEAHVTPAALDTEQEQTEDSSDDDEPITKYAKNYDSGVDLSEDVKEKIRQEVQRVTNLKLDQQQKKIKKMAKMQKRKEDKKRQAEDDTEGDSDVISGKRLKLEDGNRNTFAVEVTPEVVFADVNNIKDHQDMKSERIEFPNLMSVSSECGTESSTTSFPVPSTSGMPAAAVPEASPCAVYPAVTADGGLADPSMQQPVMHVKLSDDLTELMIEVTRDNQRTFYKYPDSGGGSNAC